MSPRPGNRATDDETENDFLNAPVSSLKEGLPLRDFIAKHETEFEVRPEEDVEEPETAAESCFNFDGIKKLVNLDMIDVDVNEDGEDGTPFDRYRRKMTDIRPDGKIKKYVVRPGVGPFVPSNAVVYIWYQAYMEYSELPFDSTLWQCGGEDDRAVGFNLAKGQMIPGLQEALLTMQKGEKAEILVHPDLAYGKFGCPPRIPPEATILFVVEVDRFIDCQDAFENQDDMDIYERKAYSNVYTVARGHHRLGKDLFQKENYRGAANKFRMVINMLHNARLANEEEEKERNAFLLKNYTNICLCYKNMNMHKRVCSMAADAVRVDRNMVFANPKLLYFWGHAKMMLGDYDSAKEFLLKAQALVPLDKKISLAILELNRRKTDFLDQERTMMKRAFGYRPSADSVRITEVDDVEEQFRTTVKEELKVFANDAKRTSIMLKEELTRQEERIYLEEAKALGLYARVVDGPQRMVHIKKPDDYET